MYVVPKTDCPHIGGNKELIKLDDFEKNNCRL